MAEIKRSMSVYRVPIIMEGNRVRTPSASEYAKYGGSENWSGEHGYFVNRVTNNLAYHPRQLLTKQHVDGLIGEGWTVTVLNNE